MDKFFSNILIISCDITNICIDVLISIIIRFYLYILFFSLIAFLLIDILSFFVSLGGISHKLCLQTSEKMDTYADCTGA